MLKDVTEQDAVEAFQARLQALGSAHDILLDQTWAAAPIDVIAERIIGQLGETGRTNLNGPAITLGPRSALSLSLILHELGTNALKYGAFSALGGRVTFSWGVSEAPSHSSGRTGASTVALKWPCPRGEDLARD